MLLLTGCSQQSNQQTQTQSVEKDPMCNPTPVRYFHSERDAKAIAEQVDGVDEAVVVQIDNEMDVAIKITNFNRFKFESIEKEVGKKLKATFSESNIHVTSDKKLINELQKLSDTPWTNKQKEACKQKKKIKEIEKQMKG